MSTTNSVTVPLGPRRAADKPDRGGKAQPLLIVEALKKHFPIRGGLFNRTVAKVQAVDGISFTVAKGEVLGIVGDQFGLDEGIWRTIAALNDNFGALGTVIIGIFVISWAMSGLIYRLKGYDRIDLHGP